MKTKKFIEKVRDLGYSIQLENHTQYKWADITVDDDDLMERDKQVARISTAWEAWGDLYHMKFSGHNEIELLNVITEYLVTPLENREEEKKYRYKFPFRLAVTEIEKEAHLRKEELRKNLSFIVVDTSGVDFAKKHSDFHFTDKEVKQYTGKDRALFDACEKIEVTP